MNQDGTPAADNHEPRRSLRRIVVVAQEPVSPFDFGVISEVFGIDRSADGVPVFDFEVAAADPDRPLSLGPGAFITAQHGLSALSGADLVAVPSGPVPSGANPKVLSAIRRAHDAGATLLATCSGVFTLAEAGLLDDRAATVHWRYTDLFARTFPAVRGSHESLYTVDGRVVTSAGTSAAVDACLHLVREHDGPRIANLIARRMVMPAHRVGGQLQYIERPLPPNDGSPLAGVLAYIEAHLTEAHSLESLSAHAHVAPRTLTRWFHESVGVSPLAWVAGRRVERAQELLESTRLPLDGVARRAGFTDVGGLRHHFRARLGISPSDYRARFAAPDRVLTSHSEPTPPS